MTYPDYAFPWHHALATEFQSLCKSEGIKLHRQHSIEIIASSFGKTAASLFQKGVFVAEKPMIPASIDWDFVRLRIQKLMPDLCGDGKSDIVIDALNQIWSEEKDAKIAGAKRLARNISFNCEDHGIHGYSGSALLSYEDWTLCGDTASLYRFEDWLAESLPWPSIQPIATATPVLYYENRYQIEPGCVLNIMAFLLPNGWQELLKRYQK